MNASQDAANKTLDFVPKVLDACESLCRQYLDSRATSDKELLVAREAVVAEDSNLFTEQMLKVLSPTWGLIDTLSENMDTLEQHAMLTALRSHLARIVLERVDGEAN